MASNSIVFVGTMTDAQGSRQVTLNGLVADPGLSVGYPLPPPPGIPTHPIVIPPQPVDPSWGIPAPPPHPAHPIVLPPTEPPPVEPPICPPGHPPYQGWSWFYTEKLGWILVWVPTGGGGKPQPPSPPAQTPPQPTPYPTR